MKDTKINETNKAADKAICDVAYNIGYINNRKELERLLAQIFTVARVAMDEVQEPDSSVKLLLDTIIDLVGLAELDIRSDRLSLEQNAERLYAASKQLLQANSFNLAFPDRPI